MTSEQIRIDAQLYCGFKIESVTAFTWVKDAVNYVARSFPLSAKKTTATTTISNKGDTYQIPKELVRLEKITKHGERRAITEPEYECDENGLITFYHTGEYDITYRYVPDPPATSSTDIDMADIYLEPIKYYLSARIRARQFGQGDSEAQTFDSMFISYEQEADMQKSNTNKRHRRMPARY